ncbi:hypothetical protein [Nocardiopsis metallicus]|uniref:Uncharacterized protein n=1 Tax=Nocardiopsis metallicus TaxID=179819 RepID=A0A840W4P4_9ACTN|nr:hypothetical protein [Nocardiopsis metallicus]MBB5490964.1 hypothetical protein [Nocardiopsis metallicus]
MNPWIRGTLIGVVILMCLGALVVNFTTITTWLVALGMTHPVYSKIAALCIDGLLVLGLFTHMMDPNLDSLGGFWVGLGLTLVCTGMVGFIASGWLGAFAFSIPVITLVMSERIVLRMIRPKELGDVSQVATNLDQIVSELRVVPGRKPGRATIAREYGLSETDARYVAAEIKREV